MLTNESDRDHLSGLFAAVSLESSSGVSGVPSQVESLNYSGYLSMHPVQLPASFLNYNTVPFLIKLLRCIHCTLKEGCLLLSSADAGAAYTSIGAHCTVPVLLDNIFTNAMQIIIS